jgi:ribosomal protein L13
MADAEAMRGFEETVQEELEPRLAPEPGQTARSRVRAQLWPLFAGMGGLDNWVVKDTTPTAVFERLEDIEAEPLSRAQLNQLLILSHEAGMSQGYFTFYWLTRPERHIYDVAKLPTFDPAWLTHDNIVSLDHLKWGLTRIFSDALLVFGSVRTAYRALRSSSEEGLKEFFQAKCIDTRSLGRRGRALPLGAIVRDDRYLIAEKACKSLEGDDKEATFAAIHAAYEEHVRSGGRLMILASDLIRLTGDRQEQLEFLFGDEGSVAIESEADVEALTERKLARFKAAREAALENTRLYLSMVEELDVYVATSMRKREDFRNMAGFCDEIFGDAGLRQLEVRYFDPTLSAALGHVDKGIIECLMVKAAKVLVYVAGSSETLGKDAEFTMALSQGKPVIIFCDDEEREHFYRDVHPLTRLIDFNSGVPVGAIVTHSREIVRTLLNRILRNEMEYELDQTKPGFLVLRESSTGSVVRLQTSDEMLHETFWNYYHAKSRSVEAGELQDGVVRS